MSEHKEGGQNLIYDEISRNNHALDALREALIQTKVHLNRLQPDDHEYEPVKTGIASLLNRIKELEDRNEELQRQLLL